MKSRNLCFKTESPPLTPDHSDTILHQSVKSHCPALLLASANKKFQGVHFPKMFLGKKIQGNSVHSLPAHYPTEAPVWGGLQGREERVLSHLLWGWLPAQVGKTNFQNSTLGELPGPCFSFWRCSVLREKLLGLAERLKRIRENSRPLQ